MSVMRDTSGAARAEALQSPTGPDATIPGRRLDIIDRAMIKAALVLRDYGETSKIYRAATASRDARADLESALTMLRDSRKVHADATSNDQGSGEPVKTGEAGVGVERGTSTEHTSS